MADQWNAVERLDGCELITCGQYRGALRLGGPAQSVDAVGAGDVAVARFNADGEPLWVNGFGGPAEDTCVRTLLDQSGDLLIAGTFTDSIGFGPSRLEEVYVASYIARVDTETGASTGAVSVKGEADLWLQDMQRDAAGNVYISGVSSSGLIDVGPDQLAAGTPGAFIGALDPGLRKRWGKQLVGGFGGARAIVVGGDPARLLVVGVYIDMLDAGPGCTAPIPPATSSFVAAFDPDTGECQWLKTVLGDSETATTIEMLYAVYAPGVDKLVVGGVSRRVPDSENPSSFTGSFENLAHGGDESFVATYFLDGTPLDWRWIGGDLNDVIGPLALDSDDTVLVANWFENELIFGPEGTRLVANGSNDVAVVRIRVSGEDLEEVNAILHGGAGGDVVIDLETRDGLVLVGTCEAQLDGVPTSGGAELCISAGVTPP